jgi:excisionase family DNA binding protein
MKTFCTSSEAAQMLGVALRTVQLWSESGLLEGWKTRGGHRRISRDSVQRLLAGQSRRSTDQPSVAEKKTVPANKPFSILVAEDDASLLRLYQINLEQWPMQPTVTTASDGYEALIRLGQTTPDMLILDLHMPGLDGFRVLQTIRNAPDLTHTAVAVVSGLGKDEIARRGDIPPGIPLFPKPIPFDALREMALQLAHPTNPGDTTP